MSVVWFLVRKEFAQIWRDWFILPFILLVPVLELIMLPYATTFEVSDIRVICLDRDQSRSSHLLAEHIEASDYFRLLPQYTNEREAFKAFDRNDADIIISVPAYFEKGLLNNEQQQLLITINAMNISKAEVMQAYLHTMLSDHYLATLMDEMPEVHLAGNLTLQVANWFNETLDFRFFMVPGIVVILLITTCMFLATINIVKEKEIGTIEQMNVSPITKLQFMSGKLLPFVIISLVQLTIMLLITTWYFHVPMRGSLWVIYLFALLYIVVACGLGLLISTVAQTRYQAILIGYFFLILFILLAGFFTPVENMPVIVQWFTYLNPIRYCIEFSRDVFLKGSGFADLKLYFLIMFVYAVVINLIAVAVYKKRES